MIKKSIIREFAMMERQMGRMMRSMSMVSAISPMTGSRSSWSPPVDLGETADEFFLMMEVAGVAPEKLTVILDRHSVTVSGLRAMPDFPLTRLHRMEIEQGHFKRTIPLPCPVDPENSSYAMENGLIVIRMVKVNGRSNCG